MSIATRHGDSGKTGLAGGARVSKADLRVEAYGSVDELNTALGFARSICSNKEVHDWTEQIQRMLFTVGGALASPPENENAPVITEENVDHLTGLVHRIEAIEGILSDWSIPGGHPESAAYEVARTTCRRAERNVVRLAESGVAVQPTILSYLNRLSDLIWLFGRVIEKNAGVDARLRTDETQGPRWSRAWK
ncbi:cob(I)yrinic acid a,c-diamide adenosyltransferase [Edaphobacter sp.]|uniref:cob(I)yrinic acid a,c-diamide adenosyltransferase n=1 Tax=Edaphobacter sp. TaxID=1934404 RepID=UPI002DBC11E9|nr:cob(I)yrinic acid a,c-diamide adenosyltransferase [Edaphobacter sp.]HEU5342659.1 cob(I)yrinic acid a,c-diamide adenosyltransferase [Edaphobacter sp.]